MKKRFIILVCIFSIFMAYSVMPTYANCSNKNTKQVLRIKSSKKVKLKKAKRKSNLKINFDFQKSNNKYGIPGINKDNYLDYVKPINDPRDYYNKQNENDFGNPYLDGEELFYNDYYDHWNVELVYDADFVKQIRNQK